MRSSLMMIIKFVLAFLIQICVAIINRTLANIISVYDTSTDNIKFRTTCTETGRFLFVCSYAYFTLENIP